MMNDLSSRFTKGGLEHKRNIEDEIVSKTDKLQPCCSKRLSQNTKQKEDSSPVDNAGSFTHTACMEQGCDNIMISLSDLGSPGEECDRVPATPHNDNCASPEQNVAFLDVDGDGEKPPVH